MMEPLPLERLAAQVPHVADLPLRERHTALHTMLNHPEGGALVEPLLVALQDDDDRWFVLRHSETLRQMVLGTGTLLSTVSDILETDLAEWLRRQPVPWLRERVENYQADLRHPGSAPLSCFDSTSITVPREGAYARYVCNSDTGQRVPIEGMLRALIRTAGCNPGTAVLSGLARWRSLWLALSALRQSDLPLWESRWRGLLERFWLWPTQEGGLLAAVRAIAWHSPREPERCGLLLSQVEHALDLAERLPGFERVALWLHLQNLLRAFVPDDARGKGRWGYVTTYLFWRLDTWHEGPLSEADLRWVASFGEPTVDERQIAPLLSGAEDTMRGALAAHVLCKNPDAPPEAIRHYAQHSGTAAYVIENPALTMLLMHEGAGILRHAAPLVLHDLRIYLEQALTVLSAETIADEVDDAVMGAYEEGLTHPRNLTQETSVPPEPFSKRYLHGWLTEFEQSAERGEPDLAALVSWVFEPLERGSMFRCVLALADALHALGAPRWESYTRCVLERVVGA